MLFNVNSVVFSTTEKPTTLLTTNHTIDVGDPTFLFNMKVYPKKLLQAKFERFRLIGNILEKFKNVENSDISVYRESSYFQPLKQDFIHGNSTHYNSNTKLNMSIPCHNCTINQKFQLTNFWKKFLLNV